MSTASLPEIVRSWVQEHPLPPPYVDCATAVMLKILDGKCKMKADEKVVMSALYEAVKTWQGEKLGPPIHLLIANNQNVTDEARRLQIYETRVLAETMISRPVMKQFKSDIREQGLFLMAAQSAAFIDAQQHNVAL